MRNAADGEMPLPCTSLLSPLIRRGEMCVDMCQSQEMREFHLGQFHLSNCLLPKPLSDFQGLVSALSGPIFAPPGVNTQK